MSARAGLPWARPRRELLLLALVAVAALSPLVPVNPQDQSRICLAEAMLHGRLANDACLVHSYDHATFAGHLYSDKAPGLSALELPAVALLQPNAGAHWPDGARIWAVRLLSVGLAFLACAFLVGRVSEGLAPGYGGIALVSFALGTLVAPLASVSFEHVPAATLAFAAFLLAWRRRPGLAGLVAGASVLVEYESGLIVLALAVYLARGGRRPLLAYLAGLLPAAALLGGYDWAAFGAPWRLSYRYVDNLYAGEQASGFFGIALPNRFGIVEVFAGSGGLLVVSPVLLAAAFGLVRLARTHRAEAILAATVAAVFVLVNCGYFLPYGGVSPGPRFLISALPFLALGLGPAFAARPRSTVVLAALSVLPMTALSLVWASGVWMGGSIWGQLVHLPVRRGSSLLAENLSANILSRLGVGNGWGAALVAGSAAAAFLAAAGALPWTAIRARRRSLTRRRPSPRTLALVAASLVLVLGADASAILAYPYGPDGGPQVADLSTSISASPPASFRGGEVNFVVSVTNGSLDLVTHVLLTITLPPGMRLLGRPAYTRGSGCTGTTTLVCNLDYLQVKMATPVRLGVEITQSSYQTITAAASSNGIPTQTASLTIPVGT